MGERQQTFEDLYSHQYVSDLTPRQISIIEFLDAGDYQAHIAERLGCSRSYVNKTVRQLEKYGLVKANRLEREYKGKTVKIAYGDPWKGRATTYTVTDRLKNLLVRHPHKHSDYTLCTPHYIKFKYPVLDQNRKLSLHGWQKARSKSILVTSWNPNRNNTTKGIERHQFHVRTPHAVIGIEYHGKSLIAYPAERKHIMAKSIEEADRILGLQIQEGVDLFLKEQDRDGVRMVVGTPELITKPHYVFESELAKEVQDAGGILTLPGLEIDDSLKHLGLDRGETASEIETRSLDIAKRVDQGLRNAMNMDTLIEREVRTAFAQTVPDLLARIEDQLNPLREHVLGIEAAVQGGTTAEMKVNQLVGVMASMMESFNNMQQIQLNQQNTLLEYQKEINGLREDLRGMVNAVVGEKDATRTNRKNR